MDHAVFEELAPAEFAPDDIRSVLTPADFLRMSRKAGIEHLGIARRLLHYLDVMQPELAAMWREQLERKRIEKGHKGILVQFLDETSEMLREHPRCGDIAELLDELNSRIKKYRAAALQGLDGDEEAFERLEEKVRLEALNALYG
ncbi:hypothetical protein [Rhizobium rhizogenes]|uniref:hypothetical protein n=1 Tax=Rhizobium rhizogenes TaxID=359 RepID=UPI0012955750|nr:hypothetical protein [Rhizobium rhizogenes]MQB34732.1 hypothetical protein [Rhizobium rhizogenes]